MATAGANPFALEGQTILIAGGASGIGASAAAACAALGAKLILADIADASPVAEKLRSEGRAASTCRMRRHRPRAPSSGSSRMPAPSMP